MTACFGVGGVFFVHDNQRSGLLKAGCIMISSEVRTACY